VKLFLYFVKHQAVETLKSVCSVPKPFSRLHHRQVVTQTFTSSLEINHILLVFAIDDGNQNRHNQYLVELTTLLVRADACLRHDVPSEMFCQSIPVYLVAEGF
jgi:hypothetical protein